MDVSARPLVSNSCISDAIRAHCKSYYIQHICLATAFTASGVARGANAPRRINTLYSDIEKRVL